jgi:hypothetical protein
MQCTWYLQLAEGEWFGAEVTERQEAGSCHMFTLVTGQPDLIVHDMLLVNIYVPL